MKALRLLAITCIVLLGFTSFSQKPLLIDLHKAMKNKGLTIVNREVTLITEENHKGIKLSKAYGEGIVWLNNIEFSNGTIEFDVRGEDVKQHSFVGLAFHGKNDSTYDAVYLRPFQFKAADEVSQKKMLQYISLPEFTWRKLREQSPGKYENSITPAPNPNAWVKVRIVIKNSIISTYINDNKEPSMVVEKVTSIKTGSIGFYVADTSGGDFANIKITKAD